MSNLGRSALVVGMSFMATACGKKGPLIYPDMLIAAAPSAVTVQQSGSAVKLQFSLPDKNRAGRTIHGVAGVKISRRSAESDKKDVCRSCAADYRYLQTLYLEQLPTNTQRFGNHLITIDSGVVAGNTYSYNVCPFTVDGVDGLLTTTPDVRVTTPLPAPSLKIESLPTEIKLQISPHPNTSSNTIGYNVYRLSGENVRSYQPLNKEPLKNSDYADTVLERGIQYRYLVRALVRQLSGDVIESAESNEVEGMLKDDE